MVCASTCKCFPGCVSKFLSSLSSNSKTPSCVAYLCFYILPNGRVVLWSFLCLPLKFYCILMIYIRVKAKKKKPVEWKQPPWGYGNSTDSTQLWQEAYWGVLACSHVEQTVRLWALVMKRAAAKLSEPKDLKRKTRTMMLLQGFLFTRDSGALTAAVVTQLWFLPPKAFLPSSQGEDCWLHWLLKGKGYTVYLGSGQQQPKLELPNTTLGVPWLCSFRPRVKCVYTSGCGTLSPWTHPHTHKLSVQNSVLTLYPQFLDNYYQNK